MRFVSILFALMLSMFALGGCTAAQIQAQIQNPVTIQRLARDGTAVIILTTQKTPVEQQALAGQIYQVAQAVQSATQANPDLSSIHAIVQAAVTKEVAKLNTPLAPFILLAFLDAADTADGTYLTAFASATATDKGKAAQAFLQLVLAGVEDGARLVNPGLPAASPATQPVTMPVMLFAAARPEVNAKDSWARLRP